MHRQVTVEKFGRRHRFSPQGIAKMKAALLAIFADSSTDEIAIREVERVSVFSGNRLVNTQATTARTSGCTRMHTGQIEHAHWKTMRYVVAEPHDCQRWLHGGYTHTLTQVHDQIVTRARKPSIGSSSPADDHFAVEVEDAKYVSNSPGVVLPRSFVMRW